MFTLVSHGKGITVKFKLKYKYIKYTSMTYNRGMYKRTW